MDSRIKSCSIILCTTVIIAGFIVGGIIIANSISVNRILETSDEPLKKSLIFVKANKKCGIWLSMSSLWLVVEYICVLLPFELSAAVLYLENTDAEGKHTAIIVFSVVSMALIILAYAIRPHDHVQGYRKAYVNLDYAINQYIGDDEYNESVLIAALNRGENYINGSFFVEQEIVPLE